jgi:D-alanyl-D-alanine carboxypeptidase/D-alanyl-D-alanine-endopeptidase (penicillin-binding protein 4)
MKKIKESDIVMTLVRGNKSLVIGNWLGSLLLLALISSCSVSKQVNKYAKTILLNDTAISTGHIGISIFDATTGKYWYNYNADKYFIPASNTKLFTLYAGMKYLGDSLTGLSYQNFSDTAINVSGTGDPTFMHPDFKNQPTLDFLKAQHKAICISGNYTDSALGYGWAWDDYNDDYMVERNALPIYGNVVSISIEGYKKDEIYNYEPNWKIIPPYFQNWLTKSHLLNTKSSTPIEITKTDSSKAPIVTSRFTIARDRTSNDLTFQAAKQVFKNQTIPIYTNGIKTAVTILKNDLALNIREGRLSDNSLYPGTPANLRWHKIKSQPSDSLFKPMMHRSDNFFAEQTLLMVSNERIDKISTRQIIETLLNEDLKDVPQRPKWVDGSGLSRYNLFTPRSFVYILNKMKTEFGLERIKNILPTGGSGTLSSYYKKDSGYIYAKTGTLSNNCALSGYLITKKGKVLIFSVLANNYITSAGPVRKAVEEFLLAIRENY